METNTRALGEGDGHARHRLVLVLLWTAALLLVALTWSHVLELASENRQRELVTAERDLANLTRLSQEHALRTFRSADQVIRFVLAGYREQGERLDLETLRRRGVIDSEIFNQISIIDAKGILILADRPIPNRMDLSDREHFKVHVAQDSGRLFVSKPVVGRLTNKWSIQLTRRINRPDGSFGGVVVLSIDPNYFNQFYGDLNLGQGGMTALYGQDGIARVRRIGERTEYGSDASRSPVFQRLSLEKPAGSYKQKSVVDGVERLYYYRTLPQVDMLVMAGYELDSLLGDHQKAVQALNLQAALVTLLILVLTGGFTRYLQLLRRDTAARRLSQAQLQERQAQLDAVFEMSPDGFVSFDHVRCVKFVNPAFRQMTGAAALTLEGMTQQDFSAWLAGLCDASAPFCGLEELRRKADRQDGAHHETIELKDFGRRILQLQLRSSESGNVSQILYARDITHETEVETLKGEFMATAAHELRTPMASVFGFAEVLLTQEVDAESQKEFLGIILKQSRLIVNILNELLDLARIEARRGKDFHYARVHLQDLLSDLIRAYQLPAGRAAPELDAPAQAIHLQADAGKLRQALLNILSNAYKYSPDGGAVRIEVALQQSSAGTSEVAIRISDHGMGMTPAQAEKVFTRFYRADTSGKVPGTGLGMSICKEIIEHHHGRIDIISALGAGSQFTVTLPVLA